jgi:peroxiredoxin
MRFFQSFVILIYVFFPMSSFSGESLNKKIQQKMDSKKKSQKATPQMKKNKEIMKAASRDLEQSDLLSKALKRGDQYIDFTLPNAKGINKKLSDLLKDHAVVLTFYRGGWCPYCNLQLNEYQSRLKEFQKAGAQLVAISPDAPQSAQDTASVNEIQFEILSDQQNKVAKKYGLVFQVKEGLKEVYLSYGINLENNQGNDLWELPIPATYVISKKGKIVYAFLNTNYKLRAEPDDILKALNKL